MPNASWFLLNSLPRSAELKAWFGFEALMFMVLKLSLLLQLQLVLPSVQSPS